MPQVKFAPRAVDVGAAIGDVAVRDRFLGGRDDADCDSGDLGRLCRIVLAAGDDRTGANRPVGNADGASLAADGVRGVRAAPGQTADNTLAGLPELRAGPLRRRLSPLFPRPQRDARLHRDLRAGVPAERHGDRASHELLLAPRLSLVQRRRATPISPTPTTSADVP